MPDLRRAELPWYKRFFLAVLTTLGGALLAVGVYYLLSRLGY
jgi:hypothetical protein